MGKHTPLTEFLKAQDSPRIVMSFAEIEHVLGEPLPEQAQTQRGWWRDDAAGNAVAHAWLEAGFTPDLVDMDERRLMFRRQEANDTGPVPGSCEQKRHPMFGALKGLMTIAPGVDLTQPADPDWADIVERKVM